MVEQGHERDRVLGSFLFLNLDGGYSFFVVMTLYFSVLYSLCVLFQNNSKFLNTKYCALLVEYIFCTWKKINSQHPLSPYGSFYSRTPQKKHCLSLFVVLTFLTQFTTVWLSSLTVMTSMSLIPLVSSELLIAFSSIWHIWSLSLHWNSLSFGLQETTLFSNSFILTGYSSMVSFLIPSLSNLLMWSSLSIDPF